MSHESHKLGTHPGNTPWERGSFQNCALHLAAVGAKAVGADVMAGSLMDVLHMLSGTHTFVAFIDIFKAFDTSWVEATLVELFSMEVHGRLWC